MQAATFEWGLQQISLAVSGEQDAGPKNYVGQEKDRI